jgi:glycosyltransferase involved in cell wall biosynthesis
MTSPLKFTIVTPSYRQLRWLKLCAASVEDQRDEVEVEHLIQDARSGPELADWVRSNTHARLFVESDSGMYDAINRGFQKATGDIVAWLNCDEQYFPGALAQVAAFFEAHPAIDVLFGDTVLIDEAGSLLSYRRAILPTPLHLRLSHRDALSCATFVRRSVIERGFWLNPEWKVVADAIWIADLLRAKVRMAVLPKPLAAFTLTRENLSQTNLAREESLRWREQSTSPWMRSLRLPMIVWHRLRKLFHGAYASRDFDTRLYTQSSNLARVSVSARNIPFSWPRLP